MAEVTVMGAGAWGTAFGMILADAGNHVRLWARRAEVADDINQHRRNRQYLGDVELPTMIRATTDPQAALDGAHAVVLAVPSQQLRANISRWQMPADAVVISLAKGIETGTLLRMSEVIADHGVPPELITVLSGPNLAGEIVQRQPAACVVACVEHDVARSVQSLCRTTWFRPYTNTDVVGTEIGGATKNPIALAVGMGVGLGVGANAQASLITRGLAETTRLGEALGADSLTFSGLAGMGDLVATCFSPLSRNRTFGEALGRGFSVSEATESGRGITEGVRSAVSILELASRHGVEMPVVERVVGVLNGSITPAEAIRSAMARDSKPER